MIFHTTPAAAWRPRWSANKTEHGTCVLLPATRTAAADGEDNAMLINDLKTRVCKIVSNPRVRELRVELLQLWKWREGSSYGVRNIKLVRFSVRYEPFPYTPYGSCRHINFGNRYCNNIGLSCSSCQSQC